MESNDQLNSAMSNLIAIHASTALVAYSPYKLLLHCLHILYISFYCIACISFYSSFYCIAGKSNWYTSRGLCTVPLEMTNGISTNISFVGARCNRMGVKALGLSFYSPSWPNYMNDWYSTYDNVCKWNKWKVEGPSN